jgi:KUP system potassium uptake protein
MAESDAAGEHMDAPSLSRAFSSSHITQQRVAVGTVIAALGTVYGDIGTSPLYALREALAAAGYQPGQTTLVFGVLSLIFWSLLIVVTLKYVLLILRADNDGEGGTLSMLALIQGRPELNGLWMRRAVALGVLGAALFYCDALITPAISVLSAVEGLELLNPDFKAIVLPVTLGIIIGLFGIQRRGTASIGRLFGPIMILWFSVLGVLGGIAIAEQPAVLLAINPLYGVRLLVEHPGLALAILAAVFLVLTGGEALYADMGHFGKRPVRIAWFALVWPGLLLNYFGQGALLMSSSAAIANPFYALAPAAALPWLVLLATAATVIASQATISGAYSVTRQAVQLDLLPRLRILQTSEQMQGQIFVPAANHFMLVAVVLLVIGFGSSSSMASAYGASVVGTMFITTLFGAAIAVVVWRWTWWRLIVVFGTFLLVDAAFFAANLTKIASGGWVTLLLAAALFGLFVTWRDGRIRLRERLKERAVPYAKLPELLASATCVPGAAVFLVSHPGYIPTALLRNLEHNRVYHQHIVVLHLEIVRSPRHELISRATVQELLPGIYFVRARFGFMETPSVNEALRSARLRGLPVLPLGIPGFSYFIGQHLVRALPRSGWPGIKLRLFARMQHHSAQAAAFFRMPPERVVVLATDIGL